MAPLTVEERKNRLMDEALNAFQSFNLERRVDPDAIVENNNYYQ
jgi:hypothetical protein